MEPLQISFYVKMCRSTKAVLACFESCFIMTKYIYPACVRTMSVTPKAVYVTKKPSTCYVLSKAEAGEHIYQSIKKTGMKNHRNKISHLEYHVVMFTFRNPRDETFTNNFFHTRLLLSSIYLRTLRRQLWSYMKSI